MCVSDDGNTLVSGGGDSTARVWDVTPGRRPRCKHVLGPVRYSAGQQQQQQQADGEDGRPMVIVQQGHSGWILSVAMHGNNLLATAGADTHVRLWDIRSGDCLAVLQQASKGNL
eukprot:COSAG06_NODE_28875_length_566_cov_1.027837_2_plen_113_part_01